MLLIFWILRQYKNYKILYTEFTITFQSFCDDFQALYLAILSLYDCLLRSYITGELRTQSINFSSNSSLQLMVYKNTTAVNKQQFFMPVVTRLLLRHAEVKDRAAAFAQCHGGTFMSATLKIHPPSKPQLWLLRAASRLSNRHCVVVKNQGFIVNNYFVVTRIVLYCYWLRHRSLINLVLKVTDRSVD